MGEICPFSGAARNIHGRAAACLLLVAMAILIPVAEARAQYFGRNKVEYDHFDFRILETGHFDVYYDARDEPAARMAAQLAERWYARFARILRHELTRRQPLVLYGSQAEFAQTNVVTGFIPDTVGGITEGSRRRIVMPLAPSLVETNRVLGHEIVHAFQFDIARAYGGGTGQPLWFIEGMAEYLVRGRSDAESRLWLRDAVRSDRLPKRERDAARHLSPYQYGHVFWAYLAERFGDEVVEKALKPGKRAQRKLTDRMRSATGQDLEALFVAWRAAVTAAYAGPMPGTTAARPSVRVDRFGDVQLGPALSPDGRQAVFFSQRDRVSLDLFLADLPSGRIVRKLATTAASARFDSLQPLRSAGAWNPRGDTFAFAAVRHGHAALVLLDMRHGGADREILLRDIDQVLTPTWSPDGTAIALSALAGGFTDLFVYDLATDRLRQITADAFADLHPAWSPDGRTIAFATERYSSDLASLAFGPTRLALLDVASGEVRPVAGAIGAAQVNPQWSSDGRSLYFIANLDDTNNVFRLDLDTSVASRVTDVDTGITGLTPTSPALSVARNAPAMAFTVYRNARHHLTIIDDPIASRGEHVAGDRQTVAVDAARTPAGLVEELLTDNGFGVPDARSIGRREYTSRLSLERIGQPYVSSGGGPFGTFVRGGGSVLFGDMLGARKLGAAVQVANRLRDTSFEVRFLDQEHRWNWGAIAELEPTLRRYRHTERVEHGGEDATLKSADYLQRVQLRAAALVAYPFSRGLRLELTAGARHAAYRRELRSQVSSVATGKVLEQNRIEAPGGVPTTLAELGAALVGDSTVFGPTGPLLGSRYRLEIAPVVGALPHARVLADYRRYLMPVRPYSIAMRVLHSGRYGPAADDPRLLSSFLGSRYFVRGHGLDARYCRPNPQQPCGDELVGDRLLVGNLEVRFPIWGLRSREIAYGPLPADGFVFADGGMVWSAAQGAEPLAVDGQRLRRRAAISSLGAGIRLNAGGLPLEIVAVRALDGPAPRWSFDVGFRVGF